MEILPLAIIMVAGPQIIVPILLVTNKMRIKLSLIYILSVTVASIIGLSIAWFISSFITTVPSLNPQTISIIRTLILLFLFYKIFKVFRNRHTFETPQWQKKLVDATPKVAMKLGFILILLMPTDIAVMFTAALTVNVGGGTLTDLLMLVTIVTLMVSIPLFITAIFRKRAQKILPKVPTWIEENSWVVSIVMCVIFIYLIW